MLNRASTAEYKHALGRAHGPHSPSLQAVLCLTGARASCAPVVTLAQRFRAVSSGSDSAYTSALPPNHAALDRLPKLRVAGSNPVVRFNAAARSGRRKLPGSVRQLLEARRRVDASGLVRCGEAQPPRRVHPLIAAARSGVRDRRTRSASAATSSATSPARKEMRCVAGAVTRLGRRIEPNSGLRPAHGDEHPRPERLSPRDCLRTMSRAVTHDETCPLHPSNYVRLQAAEQDQYVCTCHGVVYSGPHADADPCRTPFWHLWHP